MRNNSGTRIGISTQGAAFPRTNRLLAALIFLAGTAGCTGYRLGSTLPAGIRSVHVPTFVNRANEPHLEVETTQAAIREFQKDGTLRVAGKETADAVLDVTLVRYELDPLQYDGNNAKKAREHRMKITADVVLRKNRPQTVLFQSRVVGESTFETPGDMLAAKREALPKTAGDLAHRIVKSVVEAW